jgi:hypothetical protein
MSRFTGSSIERTTVPTRNLTLAGCIALVLASVVFIGGCASTGSSTKKMDLGNKQYSFWPQFPAEPRVQYLVSYRYSSDITPQKSGFENLIYGKDSGVLPITKPYGIEMWRGQIYVCDIRNPGVVVLDLAKRQTRIMTTRGLGGLAQPTDIAIADDGMKYVADVVRGVIFVFDENERHVSSFGHQGFKPVGLATFGDRLYICDFATQSVLVMNRHDGSTISQIGGPGGEDGKFIRPLGIDVDTDGNIWVSDVIKCRLQKFDPDGVLLEAVGQISDTAGSFVRPKHVAVDQQNIVYVPDAAFDNTQMFNEQGQVLMFFGSGGTHPGSMNLPAGVCANDTDIALFEQYIHPAFKAKSLVLVTNQFGPNKVAVYAVGELRKGMTIDDIASNVANVAAGVQSEDGQNPLTDDLPVEPEEPAEPDDSGG